VTKLPESDVLKALHCYISDFYSSATSNEAVGVWGSLDESALLCLGVLIEEAVREILGETGDLVFTEGDEHDDSHRKSQEITLRPRKQHDSRGSDTTLNSSTGRASKKRKTILGV